jgi:predicted nucleic acid-binding protein
MRLNSCPESGRTLHIVPQNLVELWVVATRPASQNGLGAEVEKVTAELARFQSIFHLLEETPPIFAVWATLVAEYRILGKPAHDARLVAAMRVHGLTEILTFDKTGFSRFAGISVLHPEEVAA